MSASVSLALPALPPKPSRRKWALAIAVAILLHWLALEYSRYLELAGHGTPPPVAIHEVDARKLEQVRQQWRERALLLQKNQTKPDESVAAPKDARYFSDRNTRVDQERRARQTDTLPRPATQSAAPLPKLSDLGVRMRPPNTRVQETSPGADQALTDRALQEGDQNLLNTVESVYYSYYSRLYQAIAPHWNSRIRQAAMGVNRIPEGEYVARADVVFDRDGNLKDIRLLQSSGVPAFDEAIPYAWRTIARFPNPPRDLLDAAGEIHTGWTFTVTLDQAAGFRFQEPSRAY